MKVLLPVVSNVPLIPGMPTLNPSAITPVFPGSIIEADAVEHWLFGEGSESLIGLKGVGVLTSSDAPTYESNYLTTAAGGLKGLISNLPETDAMTVCLAVRYDVASQGSGQVLVGTTQAGGAGGDGKGFGLLRGGTSDTIQHLSRPNGTATAMAASALVGAMGNWIFLTFRLNVLTGAWACFVGNGTTVTGTLATAYAKSARNIALGNGYYNPSSGTAYAEPSKHAEFLVFDKYLSQDEIQQVYLRSKSRLADRGITLY